MIISKNKKGRGNWKLNNSLLTDQNVHKKIEDEIELIVCTYACTPYNQEYVRKNDKENEIDFIIKIELLWEVLQAKLRYIIINFAAKKKRKRNEKENKLIQEIADLELNITKNIENNRWKEQLTEKNNELEEIRQHKLEGALVRSRWQSSSLGEKPTKFFLNLENKFFISKHIRELKNGAESINKPNKILEEMRNFYASLFKKRSNTLIEQTPLRNIEKNIKKVNNNDRREI